MRLGLVTDEALVQVLRAGVSEPHIFEGAVSCFKNSVRADDRLFQFSFPNHPDVLEVDKAGLLRAAFRNSQRLLSG